jgi:hypothetical protein
MKVLSPRAHGVVDYSSAALFVLAPTLFGFGGTPATLARALGIGYALFSLVTAYPLGVVRAVPFPVHVAFDWVLGILLLGAPWLLGFAENETARNFFVGMGVVSVVVTALTDARRADHEAALHR